MRDVLFLQYPICDVHVALTRPLPIRAGETNPARQVRLTPGGGATTAFVAARLGLNIAQVGVIGNDSAGDVLRQGYEAEGVSTDFFETHPDYSTPYAVVLNDPSGEHAFASVLDGRFVARIDPSHLVATSRIVVLSGYMLVAEQDRARCEKVARAARVVGCPVVFDPGPIALSSDVIDRWLRLVDYLVLNDVEAARWSGVDHPEVAARVLRVRMHDAATVIVKGGAKGCFILSPEFEGWVQGYSVRQVDTTGAGDSFISGLVFGILKGISIDRSAQFANAAGAATTAKEGCGPEAATADEVWSLVQTRDPELARLLRP